MIFTTGKVRLGDVICYEIGFDGLVRSDVAAGANLLAMQTNDATFEVDGQTGETLQQLAMARIRAIESDRAVVVASTIGVSAIVAPSGQLITHSGTWQQAVLEARVPLISHRTLADTVGAWPEGIIVAADRGCARPGRAARPEVSAFPLTASLAAPAAPGGKVAWGATGGSGTQTRPGGSPCRAVRSRRGSG